MQIGSVSQQVIGILPTSLPRIARNCNKIAVLTVALAALSQLPQTDGGLVGGLALPACLAGCITVLAASTGGWGAFIGYTACKSACIALAVAV